MRAIVTGAAGFIGFHLCKRLLKEGYEVYGIDNLNKYYDVSLKKARVKQLKQNINREYSLGSFVFDVINLEDSKSLKESFNFFKPDIVFNLAAQAGVRYSIENPSAYINSNLVGFGNILENCRNNKVDNLIYASSSSVYGGNEKLPFSEDDSVDHPISLYAASKRANELMAHTYSHLYNIPATGLRFFTVYGPWGRPDMALFLFTKAILNSEPINIFNNGKMIRDFTYIDDIVESLFRLSKKPARSDLGFDKTKPKASTSWAPHRIFNIGNSNPIKLIDYIKAIEEELGIKAQKIMRDMQPGDVEATSANTAKLEDWINFKPQTSVKFGVKKFINWYKNYYGF